MSYPDLSKLTDAQIDQRLTLAEALVLTCDDPKSLPFLNRTFQLLLDEQVRRDLIHQPNVSSIEIARTLV